MNAQPQLQAIFTRIEALERQNRKLRQIAACTLLVLTTAVLTGVAPPSRTIEAQRFVLTDSGGHSRAILGFGETLAGKVPMLAMYTLNGNAEVMLAGSGLEMLDAKGVLPVVSLSRFTGLGSENSDSFHSGNSEPSGDSRKG